MSQLASQTSQTTVTEVHGQAHGPIHGQDSSGHAESRPQKIREIEIDGVKYDLAKNGKVYLVEHKQADFYGRPVAREVNLFKWLFNDDRRLLEITEQEAIDRVQGLLNLLGEFASHVQTHRDARLGRGKESDV